MFPRRMQTGGEGVQPLQAMGQTMMDKEFERPIGHRRLTAEAIGGKPVKHLIGPHRAMRLEQDFQRATAHRRQPCAFVLQTNFGLVQRARLAGAVVMRRKGIVLWQYRIEQGNNITFRLTCYDITRKSPTLQSAKELTCAP